MISFAICCHNEGRLIENLLIQLIPFCYSGHEIVVVDDNSTDRETLNILSKYRDRINLYTHSLNNNFAEHKNFMNSKCTGEWIFNIDADETVSAELLSNLTELLDSNPQTDLFYVPRINIVNGITPRHIEKWNWKLDFIEGIQEPLINWPDYQLRIYKRKDNIKWAGAVHETIVGFDTYAILPMHKDYALMHVKDIKRQEEQNEFYSTIK